MYNNVIQIQCWVERFPMHILDIHYPVSAALVTMIGFLAALCFSVLLAVLGFSCP